MVESASPESQEKRPAPWRGRPRVADPKDKFIKVRCTLADQATIQEAARTAGLGVGGYLRALALGRAGPRAVKRPRVETEHLARILGQVGKGFSNVNQIAKWCNTERSAASQADIAAMRADIATMRAALMQALGRPDFPHGD